MQFVPHHAWVGHGAEVGFVLHGILGTGNNFRSFGKQLAAARPELRLALVDLRHHGRSQGAPRPDSLEACCDDLAALARRLGVVPTVIIGHSFGGKVALKYAEAYSEELRQVWVLDSDPGARPRRSDDEVLRVLAALRATPGPFASRAEVLQALGRQGVPPTLSSWLATNIERAGEQYRWRLHLDGIEALLHDYAATDLWSFLEAPRQAPDLHLVFAERSGYRTPALAARLDGLPAEARVRGHHLPDAGHWLHVDNPAGLLRLMSEHL